MEIDLEIKATYDAIFPNGCVHQFSKKPDKTWFLCNGRNGTPDLRNIGFPSDYKWYIRRIKEKNNGKS